MRQSKEFNEGPRRVASHALIFNDSPGTWQNGLPAGNGQFGGLFYQPEGTVLEFAFTRLDIWKRRLAGPGRMKLDRLKYLLEHDRAALDEELAREFHDSERPGFKPAGRLSVGLDSGHGYTLFDKNMKLELDKGEISGSYEISSKAMQWSAVIDPDSDVAAIHLEDTYLHDLCRFKYSQLVTLYRLPDAEARILRKGVTDGGVLFIEFDFGEKLRAVIAARTFGCKFSAVASSDYPAINVQLDYELSELAMLKSSMSTEIGQFEREKPTKTSYDIFLTTVVDVDGDSGDLLSMAVDRLDRAVAEGFGKIRSRSRAFWRRFWRVSGIAIDNAAVEGLWYNNLYQLAATSRGSVAPGLFGLWNADSSAPWNGDYHGDINFSMYTWPLFALNHPELYECVFKTLKSWFPAMRRETKEYFGVAGLRFPQATGPEGREMSRGHYRTMRCSTGFYADNFWKWFLYDPDMGRLEKEILPVLESCARYYFIYCNDDGKDGIRIGPSWAPEQGVFPAWNVANDLALFKSLFKAVVICNERLGRRSPTAEKARRILERFPEYPCKDGVFLDSGSSDGSSPLCHPSYLACVVPADEVDADSALAMIALKTLHTHFDRNFRKGLNGRIGVACDLTGSWMLAAAVRLGDAKYAEKILNEILITDFVKSNGMFSYIGGHAIASLRAKRNAYDVPGGQPHALLAQTANVHGREHTMSMVQIGAAMLSSVMESMLQSHGGVVRLFPAPLKMLGKRQAFYRLAAEGGLAVSAGMSAGSHLAWFEIECGKYAWDGALRVYDTGLHGSLEVDVNGKRIALETTGHGNYILHLEPGDVVRWNGGSNVRFVPRHARGVRNYGGDCPVGYGVKRTMNG